MSFFSFMGSVEIGIIFGIVALAVFLSYRLLDFPDLTVDGTFPLGAAIGSTLCVAGVDPWTALILAFVGGGLAGLVTGLLHFTFAIEKLLASIITMIALYSITLRVMGRPNISLIGQASILTPFEALFDGYLESFLVAPLVFAGVLAVIFIALNFFLATHLGLALRATGSNAAMARSQGINTKALTLLGLAISNGLVGFAGALYAQSQGSADIGMGIGTIVAGLVSVIIGQSIFRRAGVVWATAAVIVGSILYRIMIMLTMSMGGSDAWYAPRPSDLNLLTSLVVVAFFFTKVVKGSKT